LHDVSVPGQKGSVNPTGSLVIQQLEAGAEVLHVLVKDLDSARDLGASLNIYEFQIFRVFVLVQHFLNWIRLKLGLSNYLIRSNRLLHTTLHLALLRFLPDLQIVTHLCRLFEELLGMASDLLCAPSRDVVLDSEPILTEKLEAFNNSISMMT
jgi:hypothetical protein